MSLEVKQSEQELVSDLIEKINYYKRFSDDNKIEACLELEDELKFVDIQFLYNGIFSIIQ